MSESEACFVTSDADLDRLYGATSPHSLAKEVGALTPSYRAIIEASPFFVIATLGPGGLDCSPRGDPPGFVRVQDAQTLLLPDRRGNNRLDTLRNLVRDPRVALLFLVPGLNETLRIVGNARISADPVLCESFSVDGHAPRTVLIVTIQSVYFQCARALLRSRLWDPQARADRKTLPTPGKMIAEASAGQHGGEAFDRAQPERLRTTLY